MPAHTHQADSCEDTFSSLMDSGAVAHAAGDAVKALTAFESALAIKPQDTQAVSACAALLFELARPRAAFALLKSIEDQLVLEADGCANLGLAAWACNEAQAGATYFELALQLNPQHTAALTHLGMLAAREQRWSDAVAYASQCVDCMPQDETAHANLIDYLLGNHRTSEALAHWHALSVPIKNHAQIAIRQVVALALNGELDAANLAMNQLGPQALNELANFLQRGGAADFKSLFYRHALDAMQDCDWRDYARLSAILGKQALHQGFHISSGVNDIDKCKTPPPYAAKRNTKNSTDGIRIGIAITTLRDRAATHALAAELLLYDTTKFKFYIYSPTPQPQAVLSAPFAAHEVVELAHFTDTEAIWRIRLDRLDIWFDLTLNTPWYRPFIAQCRVAPLQVLPLPALMPLPAGVYDYTMSDERLEDASNTDPNQPALARLPHAYWSTDYFVVRPTKTITRIAVELPLDAFVVCVFGPSAQITPQTFALWMRLLKLVPHAVLWLSTCSRNAQANLRREASQADVPSKRLIFAPADADTHALLPLADMYLDTTGHGHAQSLIEGLQMGVPCIATGRVANSVLTAAGLQSCVFDEPENSLLQAVHLAQNPDALKSLQESLRSSVRRSPIFDSQSRAGERAKAWMHMVERSRAGLVPATFDVPATLRCN